MILSKTKKISLISFLATILFAGGLYFLMTTISTKGEHIITTAQAVLSYETQKQSNQTLNQLLDSTQEERDILGAARLNEAKAIDFLSQIELAALGADVVLTTDSLEEIVHDNQKELQMAFTIEGLQSKVQSMIAILESLPYASYLEEVTFNHQQLVDEVDTKASVVLRVLMSEL